MYAIRVAQPGQVEVCTSGPLIIKSAARRSQEDPGRARRTQEEPGGPRKSQEDPGRARRTPEESSESSETSRFVQSHKSHTIGPSETKGKLTKINKNRPPGSSWLLLGPADSQPKRELSSWVFLWGLP